MLQTFNVTGTGRQVDAKANFFRYEAGTALGADASIRVTADGNDLGSYLPGDFVRLPVTATRWILTPASANLVGSVRLGIGSVHSSRLVGQVEVVDTVRVPVMADRQGGITIVVSTPAAGQFAQAILWNNSTTLGVALHLMRITGSDVAAVMQTLGVSALPSGTTALSVFSKRLAVGGAVSLPLQGHHKNTSLVASGADLTTINAPAHSVAVVAGGQSVDVPLGRGPIILAPGTGYAMAPSVAVCGFRVACDVEIFPWS